MIALIYTDSDRVLGTLGLSSEDIEDDFFKSKDLARKLSVDLYTWLPNHSDYYVEPGTLNPPADKQFHSDCLILYCTYFCGIRVLDGILSIMAKESDGQNEYSRFGLINFDKLSKDFTSQAGYYRQTLLNAIKSLNVATRVAQSAVVAPTYDPVTG